MPRPTSSPTSCTPSRVSCSRRVRRGHPAHRQPESTPGRAQRRRHAAHRRSGSRGAADRQVQRRSRGRGHLDADEPLPARSAPPGRVGRSDHDRRQPGRQRRGRLPDQHRSACHGGASETTDEIRLLVSDNGPGVPDDMVETIFIRGFSTKPDLLGGRGIGLPLVRLICTQRGGTVSVHHDDGAHFTVRLPRVSA
ncbi:ATP-binding protein [Aeromicrobium sp. UC242_57]|uniref:ATP-binding protein n=1 Tax=Aeromicrobium sp. UC242_57 TaxID=3374624 RepID=UPI0037BA36D9